MSFLFSFKTLVVICTINKSVHPTMLFNCLVPTPLKAIYTMKIQNTYMEFNTAGLTQYKPLEDELKYRKKEPHFLNSNASKCPENS